MPFALLENGVRFVICCGLIQLATMKCDGDMERCLDIRRIRGSLRSVSEDHGPERRVPASGLQMQEMPCL